MKKNILFLTPFIAGALICFTSASADVINPVSDPDGDGVPSMLCIPMPPSCVPGELVCTPIPDSDPVCVPGEQICIAQPDLCTLLAPPGGDNCPLVANPDQSDVDNDTIGDKCDSESGVASCTDGLDNDANSLIDASDPACRPVLHVVTVVNNYDDVPAELQTFALHVNATATSPLLETRNSTYFGRFWESVTDFFSTNIAFATAPIVSPQDFPGSDVGTDVVFSQFPATYSVFQAENPYYETAYSQNCEGGVLVGENILCTVTNTERAKPGTVSPQCSDGQDNDGDKHADFPRDKGCESSSDNDESGGVYPADDVGDIVLPGSVLGVATGTPDLPLPPGCNPYIKNYLKYGRKNNIDEVKNLQVFLNEKMSAGIEVNGVFGPMTKKWVKKFQVKFHDEILKPWIDAGYSTKFLENGTGFVYVTTRRAINMQMCATLAIPMPEKLEPHVWQKAE